MHKLTHIYLEQKYTALFHPVPHGQMKIKIVGAEEIREVIGWLGGMMEGCVVVVVECL